MSVQALTFYTLSAKGKQGLKLPLSKYTQITFRLVLGLLYPKEVSKVEYYVDVAILV